MKHCEICSDYFLKNNNTKNNSLKPQQQKKMIVSENLFKLKLDSIESIMIIFKTASRLLEISACNIFFCYKHFTSTVFQSACMMLKTPTIDILQKQIRKLQECLHFKTSETLHHFLTLDITFMNVLA